MARTRRRPAGPNEPRSWLEDPTKFGTVEATWRDLGVAGSAGPESDRMYRVWISERRAAMVQHDLAVQVAAAMKLSGVSLREALQTRQVPYNYSSLTRVLSGERPVRLAVLFALADAFDLTPRLPN